MKEEEVGKKKTQTDNNGTEPILKETGCWSMYEERKRFSRRLNKKISKKRIVNWGTKDCPETGKGPKGRNAGEKGPSTKKGGVGLQKIKLAHRTAAKVGFKKKKKGRESGTTKKKGQPPKADKRRENHTQRREGHKKSNEKSQKNNVKRKEPSPWVGGDHAQGAREGGAARNDK